MNALFSPRKLLIVAAFSIASTCVAASNARLLPPCAGNQSAQWDACTGQQSSNAGWVYEGVFRSGTLVSGTLVYPDRRFYIGGFQEGLPHGDGRIYDPQGNLISLGWWEKGRLIREERNVSSILSTCPGDPRRSFVACFGVERFPDGSFYVGEWLNGRWNGLGVSGSDAGRWENGVLRERLNLPTEFFPVNGVRPSTSATPPTHLFALLGSSSEKKSQAESSAGDRLTFESAKRKCGEIGFKVNTEPYGRCVLQLSK